MIDFFYGLFTSVYIFTVDDDASVYMRMYIRKSTLTTQRRSTNTLRIFIIRDF